MTDIMTQTRTLTSAGSTAQERRRPGRMQNPSPDLIALMRKPTAEARRQVALYDAPNFVLPRADAARRRAKPLNLVHIVGAIGISGGAFGGAFSAMMMLWG